MLKIRLTRRGKKNKAFFRVVVAEHTSPIKGKFLENLGFLNPHTKEKKFKADRIKYWIEKGAQCSDTVHNLLVSNSVISGPKKAVKIKKKPVDPAVAEAKAGEEKKEEVVEAKPESKEAEKPAGVAEPKKESASSADKEKKEEKIEDVKPEPEKKEETKSDEKK